MMLLVIWWTLLGVIIAMYDAPGYLVDFIGCNLLSSMLYSKESSFQLLSSSIQPSVP